MRFFLLLFCGACYVPSSWEIFHQKKFIPDKKTFVKVSYNYDKLPHQFVIPTRNQKTQTFYLKDLTVFFRELFQIKALSQIVTEKNLKNLTHKECVIQQQKRIQLRTNGLFFLESFYFSQCEFFLTQIHDELEKNIPTTIEPFSFLSSHLQLSLGPFTKTIEIETRYEITQN